MVLKDQYRILGENVARLKTDLMKVWLRVEVAFFVLKSMSIIFFYFLKIIFDINTSKRSKKYKLHLI